MENPTGNIEPIPVSRYDALAVSGEGAKRDLEATAWAIALATPGLFAGLGQVDKLFKATKMPWAFGYVFAAMTAILLVSILLGLKNYTRLHSILSVHNAIQSTRGLREARQELVQAEWARQSPDIKRIEEYDSKIQAGFQDMGKQFDILETLQRRPWHLASLWQRRLLEWAYILFIVIILTSDFSKLLPR